MTGDSKPKMLKAHVTHLEMREYKHRQIMVPTRPALALLKTENMPVSFYRYLYEQVGKPFHWYERRVMSDEALAEKLASEDTLVDVLYADGCPAGFFEINKEYLPEKTEITYFGLTGQYTGCGLGKWFLNCAIQSAWQHDPEKVVVSTNSLDHPAALQLYQRMGFSPVGTSEEEVTAWE